MFLNVLLDLLLGDHAHRRTEISPRPQVLSPIALLQMRKFLLQFPRRYSLQVWHDFGWTQQRWTRHQHRHMVSTHMPLQNGYIPAQAHLSQYLTRPLGHLPPQDLIAVFRHPHQMILDVIERVRSFAIVWHATFSPSGLKVILPCFLAKAIRLKAKVLDLAHGNKARIICEFYVAVRCLMKKR